MSPSEDSSNTPAPPAASRSGLARSAGVAGAATLASRLLGLARDQVLAVLFGAGHEMDAFVVAFRIPNLVRDLFAEGTMSAAFVPAFTRRLASAGRPAAWRFANNAITTLLLGTLALVACGMLVTAPLVGLYAGDYAAVPGKLELTIQLTRVMLPFLLTIVLAVVAMGMLNALHHFFVPALSPAMFNVATIACGLALVPLMPRFGQSRITAIAIGVLIGGAGQVLIQWLTLRREGFRYTPVCDPTDRALRDVLVLMGPGTIGLAATQINLFINTLLATGQGAGAVSWLIYASRLMYLPIGLFGVSIATASLPAVSRHAAAEDIRAVRATTVRGLALMLMFNVPATLGLLALARPIVTLLFEHGQFTEADTEATAAALRLYVIGLVGYSAARIAAPTLYALQQSRLAVAASVTAVAANVVLSVWLVQQMGFGGLALATSLAALGNGALLVALLRRHLDGIDDARLGLLLLKTVAASGVMALAAWQLEALLSHLLPGRQIVPQGIRVGAAIGGGMLVLVAMGKLLRIAEFAELIRAVRTGLKREPGAAM